MNPEIDRGTERQSRMVDTEDVFPNKREGEADKTGNNGSDDNLAHVNTPRERNERTR
jgi:hypothetical protein